MRFLRANGRAPRGERGEVSWVGLVLLLLMAGLAYVAWVWIPIYVLHQDVEQIVRETGYAAVRDRNDAELVARMTAKLRQLAVTEVEDASGKVRQLPVVDVAPQDVVWQRKGDRVRVSFAYSRDVLYPWIGQRQERVMTVDLMLDVSAPIWEKK